jgi:hypothetical protein
VNAAVERTHAAQVEREAAAGSRGRRRRAAMPSPPSGAGDGSTYRPGSAADGTGSGNRRVRRRTELRSTSGNAADAVGEPASPPTPPTAAGGADTAVHLTPQVACGLTCVICRCCRFDARLQSLLLSSCVVRADASTEAGRQGRTIGIVVGRPFTFGRHSGHGGAPRACARAAAPPAGQQQADQHASAVDQVSNTLISVAGRWR